MDSQVKDVAAPALPALRLLASVLLDAFLAVLVVNLPLLSVGEHLVRCGSSVAHPTRVSAPARRGSGTLSTHLVNLRRAAHRA